VEEKLQILLKEKFNKNLDNCSKEEIFEALLLLTKEANSEKRRRKKAVLYFRRIFNRKALI
jgi:starch phosphorylase